jgi:hypothetical protein
LNQSGAWFDTSMHLLSKDYLGVEVLGSDVI